MDLQLKLGLRLEQRLELRLKVMQELKLELKQTLPEEFREFINIEEDGDSDILMQSLPFLALHELSHPLYDKGYVEIPKREPEFKYRDFEWLWGHNTIEVGIDRAAILIGSLICGYSAEEMCASHLAMVERIFRDLLELEKFPIDYSFLARLDCALKEHFKFTKRYKEEIQNLEKELREHLEENLSEKILKDYGQLVEFYGKIYSGTKIIKEGQEIFMGREKQSFYLH